MNGDWKEVGTEEGGSVVGSVCEEGVPGRGEETIVGRERC